MTTVAWPTTLPDCAEQWTEKDRESLIRTPMETGPPKVRRRFTAPMREFTVTMTLRNDQVQPLRDFYDIDCAQGVNSHYFIHPYLQTQQAFRFMAPPQINSVTALSASVQMQWEQFPGI
jgi:hypothetical protein